MIALATLCLNEMEWLPKLYAQHKDWPDLGNWVFVESADEVYAATSPELVSDKGLSVDGTSDFLADLARRDNRVQYIPYGFARHQDPALCKTVARQQYLNALAEVKPDFIVILDGDEFYCRDDQATINRLMTEAPGENRYFCFTFTHIWHPPSVIDLPLFTYEVVGGFWAMRHQKGIRWSPDLHYVNNHQCPDKGGDSQFRKSLQFFDLPACIHMAFASAPAKRCAKHDYYVARGEFSDSKRRWYVQSRQMFSSWQPGNELPRGARVRRYKGPIPEVFH